MSGEYGPEPELIAICKHIDCDHTVSVANEGKFAGLHLTKEMLKHDHGMKEISVLGKRCPECGLEIKGVHGSMKGGRIMVLPCSDIVLAEKVYASTWGDGRSSSGVNDASR